ncbi:MAG: glutathione S-transferase family protein, partial [Pseudomonadota bacterium]
SVSAMKRLYHWMLDPAGRTARLALSEKGQDFMGCAVAPGAANPELDRLAVGAVAPALVDSVTEGRVPVVGLAAILGHLEEVYPAPRLLPVTATDRAEARRLVEWTGAAFGTVNETLLAERVSQWVRRDRQPDSGALRRGAHALRGRLTLLNALAGERAYIAGRNLTFADLAVAAQLSCLDYFGDVDWSGVPDLKAWYARMKSRPSFRPLLAERVEGARAALHYDDLDF